MNNRDNLGWILFSVKKFSLSITLSLFLSHVITIGSIFPFLDTDFTSSSLVIALVIAILIPFLIIIVSGKFWIYKKKVADIIEIITLFLAVGSAYWAIFDLLSFNEWIGIPYVMQFGLAWIYSYIPYILYIATTFSVLLCTYLNWKEVPNNIHALEIDPKNIQSSTDAQESIERTLVFNILLALLIFYLYSVVYNRFGYSILLIIQVLMIGILIWTDIVLKYREKSDLDLLKFQEDLNLQTILMNYITTI